MLEIAFDRQARQRRPVLAKDGVVRARQGIRGYDVPAADGLGAPRQRVAQVHMHERAAIADA